MTPPLNEKIVRQGNEVEDDQIKEKEVPPRPTLEMINQVLTYLSVLSDQGQEPQGFLHQHIDVQWFHGTSNDFYLRLVCF